MIKIDTAYKKGILFVRLYGVINKQGSVVIYPEYDEIGVDKTLYKDVDITNPYLLYNNCIPVCKDKKWGIYNTVGKLLMNF